jgi:23S rRNA pseudouridine1911/1915/1917 synthase
MGNAFLTGGSDAAVVDGEIGRSTSVIAAFTIFLRAVGDDPRRLGNRVQCTYLYAMSTRTLPSPLQTTGLLEHLFATLSDTKRTRVRDLLRSGLVHVDGVSVTQHDTAVHAVSIVEIHSQRTSAKRSFPFEVLFEDTAILVINKPNGLLTVSHKHEKTHSVESIVNRAFAASRERCYIVQRLDLYTSGVLVLAKTEFAQKRIQERWGESEKIYHAIVEGLPNPANARLVHFLKENERLRVQASELPSRDAIKATLFYEVLKHRDDHTLVRIKLKTGKKNQIRAQMTAIGHPIAGDAKYGATTNPIARLCLHASSLSFDHPTTNRRLLFETPLPDGMDW